MTASPVEPLTKKEAGEVAESFCYHVEPYWRKLVAIGIGHHRVVPVMTEAQAAEAFEAKYPRPRVIEGNCLSDDIWCEQRAGWLAALRHVGLIGDTNG